MTAVTPQETCTEMDSKRKSVLRSHYMKRKKGSWSHTWLPQDKEFMISFASVVLLSLWPLSSWWWVFCLIFFQSFHILMIFKGHARVVNKTGLLSLRSLSVYHKRCSVHWLSLFFFLTNSLMSGVVIKVVITISRGCQGKESEEREMPPGNDDHDEYEEEKRRKWTVLAVNGAKRKAGGRLR